MHIVIISAVYPPEPLISASMSHDLALSFVNQGLEVTVICPQPSRPANADYRQYKNTTVSVVGHEDGIKIVRLPSFAAPESRLLPRLYESWSFGRHVCQFLANCIKKPDVIYINAWPLMAQAQIIRFAERNKIPAILQIMDIYPEALFAKLPAFSGHVISPLLKLDRWIAKHARFVVVISDSMRCTYIESRKIPEDLVFTIPTWQDDSLFEKIHDRIDTCRRYGIPDYLFTFFYLGNIGPVAGVDFLIRAFHKAAIATAQLVIVGDGSAKAGCIRLTESLKVANIHFVSDPDAANVPLLQSMADVCLLPMMSGTGMSSIPSKLTAYLFSAKPVLATVDVESDTARLIQEAGCGWVGAAEDLDWIVNKLRAVASMSNEELSALGEQGKTFGKEHYSKSLGVKRLADIITNCGADYCQKPL